MGNVNIGANPSAEEQEETLDDSAQNVIDVVHTFRLQETPFNKKSFGAYMKMYFKKLGTHIQENNPDRLKTFQSLAKEFVTKWIQNFDDYSFYTGESTEEEGMIVLMGYRENQITPYFIFVKDGLLPESV